MTPFNRTTFGATEPPVSADHNRQASRADQTLRDVLQHVLSGRVAAGDPSAMPYSGFVGHGFAASEFTSSDVSVEIAPGVGFIHAPGDEPDQVGAPGLANVADLSAYKPVVLENAPVFRSPRPPVGQARIDLVEVRYDRHQDDQVCLRVEPPDCCAEPVEQQIFKTLGWAVDGSAGQVDAPSASTAALSYKIGVAAPAGTEAMPAPTPGYIPIARVNSVGGAGFRPEIVDLRRLLAPGGVLPFSASWRLRWNGGAPIVTTLSIQAPAGVRLGLRPMNTGRGQAEVYVVGGNPTGGTIVMNASYMTGLALLNSFAVGVQDGGGAADGNARITMTAADANSAFLATPSVPAGVGATALRSRIASRFVSLSGINVTDASLEDAVIRVSGTLNYT